MQKLLNPLLAVKTKSGYSIITAVVVTLFSTWVLFDATKAEVVIAADGDVQTVKTHTATVGELLDDLGIDLGTHDELSHEEQEQIKDGMEITLDSANEVDVVVDGETETYYSTAETVGQFLEEEDIEVSKHDDVSHHDMAVVSDDMEIVVDKAFKVTLNDAGEEKRVWTTDVTVKEFLKDNEVTYKKKDKIKPALDEKLEKGMTVTVTKVKTKTEEVTESISFNTEEEKDSDLEKGKTRTISEGEEGEVVKTYKVTYENGEEVNRDLVEEDVKKEAKDKVVAVGTKEVQQEVQQEAKQETKQDTKKEAQETGSTSAPSGGKELTMEATAYGPDCAGCSGITATGMDIRSGTQKVIAVDPSVIPLGSRVWVEGYGEAIAADTGGAIKGNIIDVLVPSEAYAASNWGRRTVKVKILN